MGTCFFRSALAPRLQAFWETHYARRQRGLSSHKILLSLDRFLMNELKPGQSISRELVERWNEGMAHLSPNTRINRLCVLRRFCRYLSYFDPDTCIIHSSFSPRRTRPAPHIYSRQDIRRIMAAARRLGPPGSLRPVVAANLIGLLYATGLRIGEALNLTLRDMDLKRRVIEVREGKFHKSRYVPLSSSTAQQMKKYLRQRQRAGFSTDPAAPVSLNIIGNPAWTSGFRDAFSGTPAQPGLAWSKGPTGTAHPRSAPHLRRPPSAGMVSAGWQSCGQTPTALDLFGTQHHHRHRNLPASHGATAGAGWPAFSCPLCRAIHQSQIR